MYVAAGGYTVQSAVEETEARDGVVVAFGRHFLANVSGWAHGFSILTNIYPLSPTWWLELRRAYHSHRTIGTSSIRQKRHSDTSTTSLRTRRRSCTINVLEDLDISLAIFISRLLRSGLGYIFIERHLSRDRRIEIAFYVRTCDECGSIQLASRSV